MNPTRFLVGSIGTLLLGAVCAWTPAAAQAQQAESEYMRVRDSDDGDRTRLEISIRSMKPKDAGPVVHLVGVVHIGDAAYYKRLQEFLDAQDLVLFEGVKPGGLGDAAGDATADEAAKQKLTASRVRMLAMCFERHRAAHGEYPESVDAMIAEMKGTPARILTGARRDAWGREILLQRSKTRILEGEKQLWAGEEFDFISRGADGREGGTGAAADLRFSQQAPLTKRERTKGDEGMQPRMARALGLEYQLAAIDYTRPSWRNSDMTIDQVQERMEEEGIDADALFGMLDGSGFGAKVMGMVLGFIERDPGMSLMAKVMMLEAVANADNIAAAQPGNMAKMMKVIIVDRNDAVLADLKRVLDEEPGIKSIALFYGAGHLPDLERNLVSEFGYTFDKSEWYTAIEVDFTKVKGAKAQAKQVREMVRSMGKKRGGGE